MIDGADLRTFKQVEAEMPFFTYNRLRHMYARRHKNGTEELQVFVKLDNRRLVVIPNLNAWVIKHLNGREN